MACHDVMTWWFLMNRDNSVKSIHTKLGVDQSGYLQQMVVNDLLARTADMDDGWNEYILKAVGAYQMTDTVQFGVFAEYTFDTSHAQSQNGALFRLL